MSLQKQILERGDVKVFISRDLFYLKFRSSQGILGKDEGPVSWIQKIKWTWNTNFKLIVQYPVQIWDLNSIDKDGKLMIQGSKMNIEAFKSFKKLQSWDVGKQ